ncbi:MAG: hypothetical protein ACR2II_01090 [Chthoniobacterales bacterium]
MISSEEAAFYCESAAHYAGIEGAIVDLGCWLGSTSIALAQGLLSHGSKAYSQNEKVFGFDLFEWNEWMPARIPYCLYQPGESFLPEARRVVREYGGGRVELIQADLNHYQWNGGPIKILLVDAMKNDGLTERIARDFFPNLQLGSLLIHQDFKHYFTSWIHLLHYRLRDHFQFYRSVPAGTVAFTVVARIPQETVNQATIFATAGDDEIDSAFRHSLALVEPEEGPNIAAAHVMYYAHSKRKNKASRVVESYRPLGMLDKGEFPKALDFISQVVEAVLSKPPHRVAELEPPIFLLIAMHLGGRLVKIDTSIIYR